MDPLSRAAEALATADALLITAGAGMGVDSGLPDFRGDEGFWRAYPPFRALGLSFVDLANPAWFSRDPALAWGFYGHRLGLYRATTPHEGFAVLRRWSARAPGGAFVFTSNVDGAFQRAGFDPQRIVECHGAIDFVQCTRDCGLGIAPADEVTVEVDPATFRARGPLPSCPRCGGLLRPNILMFGDWQWSSERTDAQHARLERWLAERAGQRLCVIECGAGTAIPTVRRLGDQLLRAGHALVRINVREPEVAPGGFGFARGARDTLLALDAALPSRLG
ncbi:MAG: SIR2 family NAD-dependent protein deacylase [Myxococcota bacterium]